MTAISNPVGYVFETGNYRSLDDPTNGDIYLTFNKIVSGETINLFVDNIIIQETDESPDLGNAGDPVAVDLTRITPSRARANSAQSGEAASNVLNETTTLWHSSWSVTNAYPYYLEIDLGSVMTVSNVELMKRSSGTNGVILAGNVYYHETVTGSTWPGNSAYQSNDLWTLAAPIPTRSSAGQVPLVDKIVFDEPITTRYLRIAINNGSGGFASLEQFRAYGEEKILESVSVANVSTYIGKMPALPSTGTVTFTNGSTTTVPISWPQIAMSQVSKAGSFQVVGKVGLDAPYNEVTTTVTVISSFNNDVDPIVENASTVALQMHSGVTGLVTGSFEVACFDGETWIPIPFAFSWNNTTKVARFTVSDNTSSKLQLRILNIFANEEKQAVINRVFVDAISGKNGSVSPEGTSVFLVGSNQTFTITPDVGYRIEDVLVNGVSVGKVESYTFEDMQANATIEAVFSDLGGISVGYSGFTQLANGYAARIPVSVTAANLDGLKIFAGLYVDGILTGEAVEVIDGSAVLHIPAFTTASADASLKAWYEGQEVSAAVAVIPVKQLPANIWIPEIVSVADDKTTVLFGNDISFSASAAMKINGNPVALFSAEGAVLTIGAEVSAGDELEMKGIKYPDIFPSYSFTFRVTC